MEYTCIRCGKEFDWQKDLLTIACPYCGSEKILRTDIFYLQKRLDKYK